MSKQRDHCNAIDISFLQSQLRLLVVGSADLKGCNDVWGEATDPGAVVSAEESCKTSLPVRPTPAEEMQCGAHKLLCVNVCAVEQTARRHEGSASVNEV